MSESTHMLSHDCVLLYCCTIIGKVRKVVVSITLLPDNVPTLKLKADKGGHLGRVEGTLNVSAHCTDG